MTARIRGSATCIGCGQPFAIRTYGQRACSRSCAQRAAAPRRTITRRVGRSCPVAYGSCRQCEAIFVVRGSQKAYCSAHVTWRSRQVGPTPNTCTDCGLDWVVTGRGPHVRKRCPECQAVFAGPKGPAERRRRRSAARIRRLRLQLLERYGGRCGICTLPIDLSLPWTHPLSLTIDHIHPVSAGGSDDESNLWPAHRRCNEDKGDDIGYRPPAGVAA